MLKTIYVILNMVVKMTQQLQNMSILLAFIIYYISLLAYN